MPLILAFLVLLDADSFRLREAAHSAIYSFGPDIWDTLHAGEASASHEKAQRCKMLAMAAWVKMAPEVRQIHAAKLRPLGWRKLPWLWDIPAAREGWLPSPGDCERSGYPDYGEFREATRLWVADCAAKGWTLACIQIYLELLRENELRWWAERDR